MYVPSSSGIPHHGLTRTQLLPTVLDAEIRYAVHNEYAQTAVDFLARRTRLTFLNAQIALDVLPKVVEIMAQELGWSANRRRQEMRDAEVFMESMGVPRLASARSGWTSWFGSGGRVGWWGTDGTARRVLLSRAQFAAGEVELLKAAWASSVGDGRRKIDREAARGVVLERLDVPGLTGAEVDEAIAEVVRDREGVDQEEFLRVRFLLLVHFRWF
jgi:glycerol-3-phosphate dehydrogenase